MEFNSDVKSIVLVSSKVVYFLPNSFIELVPQDEEVLNFIEDGSELTIPKGKGMVYDSGEIHFRVFRPGNGTRIILKDFILEEPGYTKRQLWLLQFFYHVVQAFTSWKVFVKKILPLIKYLRVQAKSKEKVTVEPIIDRNIIESEIKNIVISYGKDFLRHATKINK